MVDYSKWKDIEISDDEDETHPNIDTPSLFRWRHQARMERMEEQKKEREVLMRKKDAVKQSIKETTAKIEEIKTKGLDMSSLQATLKKLEEEDAELKKEEEEFSHKEKLTPWNVDTISQPGFTKTIVNNPAPRKVEQLSEEESEKKFNAFIKKNESLMKQYGMLKKYDDSKRFLQEHPHLACEETANYLVIWCINLEMEEKRNLMEHVAHQCICMQYILELSRHLDLDPRACVGSFFSRIDKADEQYKKEFDNELKTFKERIIRRAQDKLDAAVKEIEKEEAQKRLGPGGLDPIEVLESLPPELQKCFEEQDIPLLQETIAKMPPEEATYHMKRCVDSGLWIPDARDKRETTSENIYEEASNDVPADEDSKEIPANDTK